MKFLEFVERVIDTGVSLISCAALIALCVIAVLALASITIEPLGISFLTGFLAALLIGYICVVMGVKYKFWRSDQKG